MATLLDIQHKTNFENYLLENLFLNDKDKFEIFIYNLIISGGIISGGSLVKTITSPTEFWSSQDVDIYINTSKAVKFTNRVKSINEIEYKRLNIFTPDVKNGYYCKSFLQKNGINHIFKLTDDEEHILPIDVVSVRNDKNVIDVVKNFDLSFCKVYYDGYNVYAFHPEHLFTKSGELSKDYYESYKEENTFTCSRIKKYRDRKFHITIDDIDKNIVDTEEPVNITDINTEKTIYHKIFNQILAVTKNKHEINNIFSYDIREHYKNSSLLITLAQITGYKNIIIPLFRAYDFCDNYNTRNIEYIKTLKESIIEYAKKELYQAIQSEYKEINNIFKVYMDLNCLQSELQSPYEFRRKRHLKYVCTSKWTSVKSHYKRCSEMYNEYKKKAYDCKNKEIIEFVNLIL